MAETEAYTTESETTDTDNGPEFIQEETDADTMEPETEYSSTDSEPELTPEEMARLLEPDPELTDDEKALQALHLVCCRELTEYDPKSDSHVCTRFSTFNIALFDLDQESEATHGPPLQELTDSEWRTVDQSSVNVISLKVIQSDVGYPINVFGTVLARDEIDYKCVYLFRRDRDDSQYIESPEDMLTLTGPRRGLVVSDEIFFEVNLKIKGDVTTDDKYFSKGVIEHYPVPMVRIPKVLAPVPYSVAAAVKINIVNGPRDTPFSGKVTAWTPGDTENHIILYKHENKAMEDRKLVEDGGSIALSRNLVAVPIPDPLYDEYEEIELTVCFTTSNDDEEEEKDECTSVTLQY